MVFAALFRVFYEEDVVDEAEQGIAQAVVLLVFLLCGEVFGHLHLCIDEIL